ncbi:MAG TPA: phosphoribosyl-AMP cyclohydrolase [Candidatus Binatia bacterium]|nr:phosphoribosyl-AMP cyclohydrolase [Candidatus Binatia bacterium]
MNELEEGTTLNLDFAKLTKIGQRDQNVVPVVLQDADSKEVLFIGYANELALNETLASRRAVLWSTSRNELWRKGETSGDVLELVDVRINCEQNSLLYLVRPRAGGVCHTRDGRGNTRVTCYYRSVRGKAAPLDFLQGQR